MKTRIALLLSCLLLASVGATASGAEREQTSQRVNFAIGCDQGDDGTTCNTTEYFLSKGSGDNNVGSTLGFTPLGYAFYTLDGSYTTNAFSSDSTLKDETYELIGGSTITGQIAVSGFVAGAEVGVDSGVYVQLRARNLETGKPFTLGVDEITKIVSTPTDTVYEFSFDVGADLDDVEIGGLSAEVGQRHITVLQNGFMNGQGESYFDLPHYEPETP